MNVGSLVCVVGLTHVARALSNTGVTSLLPQYELLQLSKLSHKLVHVLVLVLDLNPQLLNVASRGTKIVGARVAIIINMGAGVRMVGISRAVGV